MLNRADAFFALTLEGGGVTFVPKAQVVVVSCRDQVPLAAIPTGSSAARQHRARGGAAGRARSTGAAPRSSCRRRGPERSTTSTAPGVFFALWRRRHQPGTSTSRTSASSVPSTETAVARLDRLIQVMHEQRADALQLAVGKPAALVPNGAARPLTQDPLTDAQILGLVREIADPASTRGSAAASAGEPSPTARRAGR